MKTKLMGSLRNGPDEPTVRDGLIRKLQCPEAYPHRVGEIQLIETHISWVILTGEYAYKIKKPVRLGFLDFSTLALRRHYCTEELRVNRRTAPQIYLAVVPIGATADGVRVGAAPALEYAVKMRQFPHRARLDRRLQAGRFGVSEARDLARVIAHFHAGLTARANADPEAEAERISRPARNNFKYLDPGLFSDTLQQHLAVIESWTMQQARDLKDVFARRTRNGAVRECHGDLHLENLVHLQDRFVLFDAIEFNPELRWIDTANDVAFIVMDLMARGRRDLAHVLLNAWLECNGDYDCLSVMRYYLVYRSMVRAVVASIRQRQRAGVCGQSYRVKSDRYIRLAAELVDTPPARLILMHGFSGSGKTWNSAKLVQELPALRVRSDLERKRLPEFRVDRGSDGGIERGIYSPEISDRTYERMASHCETGLRTGFSMIADATFLRRRDREMFLQMAGRIGVAVSIVDCRAEHSILLERIRRRAGSDVSDADEEVLEHQLRNHDPLTDEEKRLLQLPPSCSNPGGGTPYC